MIELLMNYIKAARALGRPDHEIVEAFSEKHLKTLLDYVAGETLAPSALEDGYYIMKAPSEATVTFPNDWSYGHHAGSIYMLSEQKINAIKLVRQITKLGLKEAKDFVEGNMVTYLGEETLAQMKDAFGDNLVLK